ncbi:hypothetical protein V8C40DRAFT_265186 [Trichoderma camerunense]
MAAIKKVAVLGGSGNLGPHVVNGLLDAGFEVTVITRLESQATFTDKVTVKRIDITSKEAVESVLQGHDALVSTISPAAVGDQKTIIDAAVAAKVRRFLPSEFGVDTRRTEERSLGWILANKLSGIKTQFLLGINAKDKTGTIVDSGSKPYAATHVSFIGEAVATILKKPEETANKYLSIFSFAITQNEVLKIFEEETGSKFQITQLKGSDLIKAATDSVAKGDYANSVVPFVQYTFLADDSKDPVDIGKNDADLLGIKDNLSLRESIKKELSEI